MEEHGIDLDEVLLHPTRKKVLECIRENPNIEIKKISEKTGKHEYIVKWHVEILKKLKLIKST